MYYIVHVFASFKQVQIPPSAPETNLKRTKNNVLERKKKIVFALAGIILMAVSKLVDWSYYRVPPNSGFQTAGTLISALIATAILSPRQSLENEEQNS
jgi:hypothetical protein